MNPREKRPTESDRKLANIVTNCDFKYVEARLSAANTGRHCRITPRELQLLSLFAQGRTSKEVAHLLNLSEHTVNNHRRNMMAGTGCSNIAQLVKLVLQQETA